MHNSLLKLYRVRQILILLETFLAVNSKTRDLAEIVDYTTFYSISGKRGGPFFLPSPE